MISQADLENLATARLADAQVLLTAGRFDGAVYLCGYALELKLKARICRTLNWIDFPLVKKEFEGLASFKTHDLDILLRLSGVESTIKTNHLTEWSAAANWDPEVRYRPAGTATEPDAQLLLQSVTTLLGVL